MSRNDDTIRRFDKAARTWNDKSRRIQLGLAVADGIINGVSLNGDEQALEFGCGTGLVGLEVAPHVGHLTAVDSSSEMIAVLTENAASRGIGNITPVCRELSRPEDLPGVYDLIFTSMVLHHIPDIQALIDLFAAWCAPGGRLVIADLDTEDGSFHSDMTGVVHKGIDRDELASQLEKAGFTVESIGTVHEVARGNGNTYPMFLMVGRKE